MAPIILKKNIFSQIFVILDVEQYQYTDIVCSTLKLPFIDNCFDGIISHAVFEHLLNPLITFKELHSILKPGDLIFIDTAFFTTA